MSISDPILRIECDKCGEIWEYDGLVSLAGGGWDDRNLDRAIAREGWKTYDDGDKHICDNCADEDEEEK